MSDDRRDALTGLVESPGWALFREMVQREWADGGRRYESELDRLANDEPEQAAATVRHMQQIAVARREILKLLRWPSEELKKLAEKEPQLVALSRRGGL